MAVHEGEPNPFVVAHHLIAFAHDMVMPAGKTELVVHIGGFLYTSADDPRLQYTLMDWPERQDELDWMTPALSMKNLLGLNDLVGQCMTGILNIQIQRELRRRQEGGESSEPQHGIPDSILSDLSDVNLDPDQPKEEKDAEA